MSAINCKSDYLVTAIISTYASERFMKGCLENLISQSIFDKIEIIVIDSGSPENEGDIVKAYQKKYDNIVYLCTERETIYQAWNRAIKMSRGKYLTNANTDDRHQFDAFEKMVDILEKNTNIVLVYSDQKKSTIENEDFEECQTSEILNLPVFSKEILIKQCLTGSQPFWRSSAHDTVGYFSEDLVIAGDYDMWLKMSVHWDFMKSEEILGLYYDAEQGLEHKNQYLCDVESMELRKKYLKIIDFPNQGDVRKTVSDITFAKGYHYILNNEPKKAKVFLKNAIFLSPLNFKFYKTYFLRIILGMRKDLL